MNHSNDIQCSDNVSKISTQMEAEMEPEKGDLSPENSKKSDSSPLDDRVSKLPADEKVDTKEEKMQYSNCNFYGKVNDDNNVNRSMSMQEIKKNERSASEDPDVRNALAFTIDFGDGRKSVDTQRHEKMLERFHNRHKRGVSLSKLEGSSASSTGKMKTPQSVNLPRRNKGEETLLAETEVRLRNKNKATMDVASKRHSWSPRTSMVEPGGKESTGKVKNPNSRFTPKSTALQMAFDQQNNVKDSCSSSELNVESLDSSIGLPCIEPPLENFKKDEDGDSVSDAGTYTLDGDNYTEEQKQRMNIDRTPTFNAESTINSLFTLSSNSGIPQRPTSFQDELEIIDLDRPCSVKKIDDQRKANILEVVYFHDQSAAQTTKPKQSYLEKLKSRVKNITHKGKSPDRTVETQQINSPDQGTFTSVTTSGILSVKPSLENHPRVQRRNSLTKSHIDSSEYVQGIAKLNINTNDDETKILNCYTDSEKATGLSDYNPSYESSRLKTGSDASAIGSAVTKKDWIQEWAKNAREYSKKPSAGSKSANTEKSQMTKSYDFENKHQFGYDFDIDMTKSDYYDAKKYDEFGDNLDRQHLHRKQIDRLLSNSNSSSDPLLKQAYSNESNSDNYGEFVRRGSVRQYSSQTAAKPPMSPSKIPSPIGSISRARSISRNRSLQGSNSDLSTNETEMYLQKTAAAISTLQNLQSRNSVRNTSLNKSSQSSPLSPASRRMSPKISPMSSLQSPLHLNYQNKASNIDSQMYQAQPQQLHNMKQQQRQHQNLNNHKRNLSLDGSESYVNALSSFGYGSQMCNSLNSENMNAILDIKKQHTRHNSFEGMSSLPPKPVKCFQNFDQTTAYYYVKDKNGRQSSRTTQCADGDDDDDDDDNDEEHLIVVTSGIKEMTLGGSKKPGVLLKKQHQSSSTSGKTGNMSTRASSSITNQSVTSKVLPTQLSSPIKRSSSFSVKPMQPTTPTLTPKLGPKIGGIKIQKSASSTSFKKMVANYIDDDDDFYINNDDDLDLGPEYSSNSEFSDKDDDGVDVEKEPITNTRCNKTFLMRLEQNKKNATSAKQGVAACPNTPELPRRNLQVRGAVRDRASMPRDSSLNRMKQDLNISRKPVTKDLVFKESNTAMAGTSGKQKIQPKYLDISKYKTPNAGNFLKKDESKSYLTKSEVKKSPSSTSVGINRGEPNRMSMRSVKSAAVKAPVSFKKEAQKSSKEQELEMWRRRASYDPMRAAMEGKRKQEEAKRQSQNQSERITPS